MLSFLLTLKGNKTKLKWCFLLFCLLISCSKSKNEEFDSEKYSVLLFLLNNSGKSSSSIDNTPTCTETKRFIDVQNNATYPSCTNCHNSLSHSSGYDFSNYANAMNSGGRNQVIPNSPKTSRLWIKISTGSMSDRSDSTFNDLVYCWIKNGSPQ